jgi:CRP-like cAMP-binding protein
MDAADQLRHCFLCRQLDEAEITALTEIVIFRSLGKGEHLFWEGQAASGFFVLLTGSVRVYKASAEGKEVTLHQIRPGQMFAEAAIFTEGGFPANCMALADSEVAFFPKDRFIRLLTESPQISLKMIAGLAGFVREFSQQVEDLSLREVPGRLARFLLEERERVGADTFHLDTTKSELARRLGTTGESLSRNLRKLSDLAAIAVAGSQITLLDLPRLQSIAAGEKI